MRETKFDEITGTFPKYTVYICRNTEGVITQLHPFDMYAKAEKTYEQCKEKLENRSKEDGMFTWEEKQDKDLYEIALILKRERRSNTNQDVIHSKLVQIVYDLEEICNDMEDDDE